MEKYRSNTRQLAGGLPYPAFAREWPRQRHHHCGRRTGRPGRPRLRALPGERPARVPGPLLVLGERHLQRVLREYVRYFNDDRPHQGLAQQIPTAFGEGLPRAATDGSVRACPILGGLHHAYARAV